MKSKTHHYRTRRSLREMIHQSRAGRLTAAMAIVGLICCTALIYVSASKSSGATATRTETQPTPKRPIPSGEIKEGRKTNDHIDHSGIWSQLQTAFHVIGDRLEKPGKERITMTGALQRSIK